MTRVHGLPQMTQNILTGLTSAEAREKADECHTLAKYARKPEHRSMLARMAETWQQISHRMEGSDPPQFRPGTNQVDWPR
jgi:hypothetical protein